LEELRNLDIICVNSFCTVKDHCSIITNRKKPQTIFWFCGDFWVPPYFEKVRRDLGGVGWEVRISYLLLSTYKIAHFDVNINSDFVLI
jgi:hypothetical protein